MSLNPMSQMDSSKPRSASGEAGAGEGTAADFSEYSVEVERVARTLAAHGGGAASFDLALDLVLNDIVEQARTMTEATGAAIALATADEMVCRATTGPDAPDLGVRIQTTSGLSGACLQTGKPQRCDDTESDPRVNAEACRRLGVRSILVVPVGDSEKPFGLLEIYCPRPNAFGDQDVSTLQTLAHRVIESKIGAEKAASTMPMEKTESLAESPAKSVELKPAFENEEKVKLDEVLPTEEGSARRADVWTPVLGVVVILAAVLLGLAVGWRGAIKKFRAASQERVSASSAVNSIPMSAPPAQQGETMGETGGAVRNPDGAGSSATARNTASSTVPSSGDLVVRENGKVIFRMPSTEVAGTTSSPKPAAAAQIFGTRLVHRVDPQYPTEARTQHIQGPVVLDVQISPAGTVRNLSVVSGNPLLADAALRAVREWRFRPYSVNGQPVEMQTRITVNFTLPPN